jgi:ATP-binding cassette subfamily B protein
MLGLTLAASFAEVVSLGAVLPFIGILTQPEKVFNSPVMRGVVKTLGIRSAADLVFPLTVAFVVVVIAAGSLRLLLLWVSTRLAFATGADLSNEIYRRTLYQPYSVHVTHNSSEVISGIVSKVNGVVYGVLLPLLTLISSVALLMGITFALISIDPMVALVAIVSFGVSYGLITWISRRRVYRNSHRIAREQTQLVKALQEGLGGIRDVLLDGTQPVYCEVYRQADYPLRLAEGNNVFIASRPRCVMEAMGMVLIAVLVYALSSQPGGVASALPVLGALALGAQRLLPALQQGYGAWIGISGNQVSLVDTIKLLDQPLPVEAISPAPAPMIFRDLISFNAVKFRYAPDSPWVLNGFNMTIPKGARIGFVGSTGSGKSTTMDLLMGLLTPTEGELLVDGQLITGKHVRAWQRTIAHVPQSIYLADTTIAENIAFGVPPNEIELDRVRQAARQAQIAEFIESRPEGYGAFVGERGIRLSGGQRQRIGIARALYKQATVLVFDEATSALDSMTETAVMSAIENLNRDLTILIIAHRLTTLQNCDTIVKLEHGRIVEQGSYEHFTQRIQLKVAGDVIKMAAPLLKS